MKLVSHIFSRSKFSMDYQFHCAADTGGIYRPSTAVGGGMDGIRSMKKNNSDQTKGKPWTESVNELAYINGNLLPRSN